MSEPPICPPPSSVHPVPGTPDPVPDPTPHRLAREGLHELRVHRHGTVEEMGRAAGRHAAQILRETLERKGSARVMLAAAPSQEATLAALVELIRTEGIDVSRIDVFHMDDYLALPADAPQGFGNWLEKRVMEPTGHRARFHRIDTTLEPEAAVRVYEAEMGEEPFDLTLLGLGVNAHLAFNDPPADFDHPRSAAIIALDETSRQQQVDEGHFPSVPDVPTHAITVTIPRLLRADHMIASVPGAAKRRAVAETLARDPDPLVPGTALKLHPDAHLYIDREADPDRP